MLNTKAVTDLLSQNTDQRLCKCWYLITTNGTLLANSPTADGRQLRKQVAIVALSWQDHQSGNDSFDDSEANRDMTSSTILKPLRTLTIESETSNLIARLIQPSLLLVLEGGVPPRRQGFEPKVTDEGPGDEPYPAAGDGDGSVPGTPQSSATSSANSVVATSVLRHQRQKLEAMAEAISNDLEDVGFKIPESVGTAKFF